MARQCTSWTTKASKAFTAETIEEANMVARAVLGPRRSLNLSFAYAASQKGWVIYNATGTKMLADR